jgi:hypothetical protein
MLPGKELIIVFWKGVGYSQKIRERIRDEK